MSKQHSFMVIIYLTSAREAPVSKTLVLFTSLYKEKKEKAVLSPTISLKPDLIGFAYWKKKNYDFRYGEK